jgi:hypothetical protein
VLKSRHTLKGRNLVPIVTRTRADEGDLQSGDLARLKKDHPLSTYSLTELITEFEKLTGEKPTDVLMLAGLDECVDHMRTVLHYSILHANAVGAPKGQALKTSVAVPGGFFFL